mmetsp:Transcript_26879/g.41889  ORF Transcript_26879/g.41889 Transcript_26879/m.41889 type:complete len:213 (-) Transcript_26879:441-1079(-)
MNMPPSLSVTQNHCGCASMNSSKVLKPSSRILRLMSFPICKARSLAAIPDIPLAGTYLATSIAKASSESSSSSSSSPCFGVFSTGDSSNGFIFLMLLNERTSSSSIVDEKSFSPSWRSVGCHSAVLTWLSCSIVLSLVEELSRLVVCRASTFGDVISGTSLVVSLARAMVVELSPSVTMNRFGLSRMNFRQPPSSYASCRRTLEDRRRSKSS